jgi:glycosyltransferase involved in cell wall biosynthesis
VLFLGRVTAQKNPEGFLDAAALVARADPRVVFVVAGAGDLLPAMVERAARLGLGPRVRFTGFLEGREVARAYAAADLLVQPSRSEPFGLAPLEALVHGVPAIVSRRSGVAEVLSSAVRVDPRRPAALADAILRLLRDDALRRRLVRRGRREARAHRWATQARRLREVYGELVA